MLKLKKKIRDGKVLTKSLKGSLWVGGMLIGVVSMLAPSKAMASTVVLDFEGLQNLEPINNFYNGGTGGKGSTGTNLGIEFGTDSLAIIDQDSGGTGNFANEPTPSTVAFFLTGSGDVMNVSSGFTTGFSFYYSSINYDGSVTVYDGLNGTGNVLASLNLPALGSPGEGDPNGQYDTWAAIGVSFSGTAKSVIFSGTADQIGFDNITLGADVPDSGNTGGDPIPEPTTVAGMLLFGAFGGRVFKKNQKLKK